MAALVGTGSLVVSFLAAVSRFATPELWGFRCQLLSPASRIITVTFTTWIFCTGVVVLELQLPPPPLPHPHPTRCGGGERSDKLWVGQFLAAWGLQGGEGRENWNASWFLLSQLRVLLGWGVIVFFYDRLQGPMPWPALSHSHSHSIRLQPMRVCDRVCESRRQNCE